MMRALERVQGIMFLCFDVACTPAGSVQALFCGFLICQTRWESNSCYCFVIQSTKLFLFPQNVGRNEYATKCVLQNSKQLSIFFFSFTFPSRCWLGKFWTEMLIQLLWDPISKCWFHHYALKNCFSEKILQRILMHFPPFYRMVFSLTSLFVVDQIEDFLGCNKSIWRNAIKTLIEKNC